jgi:crotonobetainyl-CoA:carnitine CoA-transferase CaiB-like acyl-CoA transferase
MRRMLPNGRPITFAGDETGGRTATLPSMSTEQAALDGVRIADFSRVLAGPVATMVLADLGADVVKIERPGVGDDTRAWGPPWAADGESSYYLSVNRNKRSVALDLRDPDDLATACRLALAADVVVENFRPGVMARHGLDHETLAAVKPGLITCRIAGLGRGDVAGYDFLAQAVGGLMSITGDPGGEPRKVGVALVDVMTGLHAAIGILAALHHRERTGEGQLVEVDLLSSTLFALANQASNWLTAGVVPGPMGNRHPSIAPYETFHAADATFVIAVGNDGQFRVLCEVLGAPALADDERFATNAARVTNREALVEELERLLAAETADVWVGRLAAAGIPCGRVNDIAQAFEQARSLGLDPVATLRRGDGSTVDTVANPLHLSRAPVTYRTAPPRLGEHTGEVRTTDPRSEEDPTWPT